MEREPATATTAADASDAKRMCNVDYIHKQPAECHFIL